MLSPLRGYTLPLVDLDGEFERQVVVDREPGQYLGHPTTVLLEDKKTILAVYPKGHGKGQIVLKRSSDGGITWSERLPVPASWATGKETPTIHRFVDANGTKRLVIFSGLYPIRMSVSEDDGYDWTELQPIGDFGGIVVMGDVVNLGQGCYMGLFHDDGNFIAAQPHDGPKQFRVYKTLSTDGGLTWGYPEVIAEHPTAHLCEPGAVWSPDGKEIAVFLRENSRQLNSFVVFSGDKGQTWSQPKELPGALTGDRHVAKYAPDGRLVVAFRDMAHETNTKGDFVAWVGTWDDLVNGNEGQYRIRLADNQHQWDSSYPAVEVLEDGTIMATTYGHWIEGEKPFILSVRFALHEIDEKASRMKMAQ